MENLMISFKNFLNESNSYEHDLPPAPGTQPIPDGHIRLYHQTSAENLNSIAKHGIRLSDAKGYEGPKAIYADPNGFYGKPGNRETVEFHVPKEKFYGTIVDMEHVPTKNIIAIHRPWHQKARYMLNKPDLKNKIISGERDNLLNDPHYGEAIKYIKKVSSHD
jgi:hypothetical protein